MVVSLLCASACISQAYSTQLLQYLDDGSPCVVLPVCLLLPHIQQCSQTVLILTMIVDLNLLKMCSETQLFS